MNYLKDPVDRFGMVTILFSGCTNFILWSDDYDEYMKRKEELIEKLKALAEKWWVDKESGNKITMLTIELVEEMEKLKSKHKVEFHLEFNRKINLLRNISQMFVTFINSVTDKKVSKRKAGRMISKYVEFLWPVFCNPALINNCVIPSPS